jgi:beta-glucosidase
MKQGYSTGGNAPGRSSTNPDASEGDSSSEPWITGKAQIMGHARAVAAYNKDFQATQGGKIGISLNGDFYEPWDSQDERDAAAAERRMEFHIGWFANPIFLKKDYPAVMREQLGDRLPTFSDADFAILRSADTHFYGMNYYTSQYARHRDTPAQATDYMGNVEELAENKEGVFVGEQSGVHWLRSCPGMFRKHLARVYRLYGKPIYITENGCPCPGEDAMSCEEAVEDPFRIRYLEKHLDAIKQAVNEDGAVVSGYFAWSLLDNLGEY